MVLLLAQSLYRRLRSTGYLPISIFSAILPDGSFCPRCHSTAHFNATDSFLAGWFKSLTRLNMAGWSSYPVAASVSLQTAWLIQLPKSRQTCPLDGVVGRRRCPRCRSTNSTPTYQRSFTYARRFGAWCYDASHMSKCHNLKWPKIRDAMGTVYIPWSTQSFSPSLPLSPSLPTACSKYQ